MVADSCYAEHNRLVPGSVDSSLARSTRPARLLRYSGTSKFPGMSRKPRSGHTRESSIRANYPGFSGTVGLNVPVPVTSGFWRAKPEQQTRATSPVFTPSTELSIYIPHYMV